MALTFTLSNNVKIPVIGFGTYQIPNRDAERCTLEAIKAGYRCIDTAQAYRNEEGIGNAIKKCGVPREELFIITKCWVSNYGYKETRKQFEVSLKKLQLDYIDLYLLHQPWGDIKNAWKSLEELYNEGKIRAIGVANFKPHDLNELLKYAKVVPHMNQIEIHPMFQREDEAENMRKLGIFPQSWGPFAEGRGNMFNNKVIANIGKKYNKTVAQVILRWLFQREIHIIPKTVHENRMKENLDIFDFQLTDEDMKEIEKIDTGRSLFF